MATITAQALAKKAWAKLSREADRPDQSLRLLVGHASLLDSVMLEITHTESELQSWFDQSIWGTTENNEIYVQQADTDIKQPEEDCQAKDTGSNPSPDLDNGYDEEEWIGDTFQSSTCLHALTVHF